MALSCEAAALDEAGISNSDGASASTGMTEILIGTSTGFGAAYKRSSFGISAVVLAEKDGQMERDYDYSASVFAEDLESLEKIGKSAARRTLAMGRAHASPKQAAFLLFMTSEFRALLPGILPAA